MNKVTIIAEAGISHGGSVAIAIDMIAAAKESGADVFKTQCYSVDALFPDHQIVTQGKNWYEEVKGTELTKKQVFKIAEACQMAGLEFMASAFDLERLGWLEEFGVKRHKVAARFHIPELADAIWKTGKPILVSLPYGVDSALLWPHGRTQFLYCVPEYPTPLGHLEFPDTFTWSKYSGFSDHTEGIEAAMVAISRGATIIERHFCLERDGSNPDMVCSAEPRELKALVDFARKVEQIL